MATRIGTRARTPVKVTVHRPAGGVAASPGPPAAAAPRSTGTILVATDGSRAAGAALRIAAALAARDGRPVEAVAVFAPLPAPVEGFDVGAQKRVGHDLVEAAALARIRRQVASVGGAEWPFHVDFGRAAPTIHRIAERIDAGLIVLGLGHHGAVARLVAGETVLRVLRLTSRPVLAVHPRTRTLPRRAVVGVDFGESSVRAAHATLALLERPGRLHLVHAREHWMLPLTDHEAWDRIQLDGIRDAFDALTRQLDAPPGVSVDAEVIEGPGADVLRAVTHGEHPDLVAVGSHSHPLIDRLLVGIVPTILVRDGATSVLVAPPAHEVGK